MTIDPNATATNHPGRRFLGMDLNGLSLLSNAAFFVLSAFTLAAAITVFLVARASEKQKDRDLESYKTTAQLQVVEAQRQAAAAILASSKATQEATKLEVQAAELRERASQADLQLGQLRKSLEPRIFNRSVFDAALRFSTPATAEILFANGDFEANNLATNIYIALSAQGWNVGLPLPLTSDTPNILPNIGIFEGYPITILAGGQATGLTLAVNHSDISPIPPHDQIISQDYKPTSPVSALWTALIRCDLGQVSLATNDRVPQGHIRIIVSPRLL